MAGRSAPSDIDEGEIAFLDVLACTLGMVLVLLIILLPFIAEPQEEGAPPPGQLVVEIVWPAEMDVDVDLWVMAPKEEKPVGYSRRKGRIWNLLRDDLGHARDEMQVNIEHAYSRGIPDGTYTVNVHLYANRQTVPPIPVQVKVSLARDDKIVNLLRKDVQLNHRDHELTVFSWTMQSGSFVPGSEEDIQRGLREKRF